MSRMLENRWVKKMMMSQEFGFLKLESELPGSGGAEAIDETASRV